MKSSYKIALMVSALICLLVIGYYAAQEDAREPQPSTLKVGDSGGLSTASAATPPPPVTPVDNVATDPGNAQNMDDLMSRVRQHLGGPTDDAARGSATVGGASAEPAPAATGTVPGPGAPPATTPPTLTLGAPAATAPAGTTAPVAPAPATSVTFGTTASPAAVVAAGTARPMGASPATTTTLATGSPAAAVSSTTTSLRPAGTSPATTTSATTTTAAAARPASAPAAGPATYTIKSGDTLSSIAERLYGDERRWVDIAQANPLVDPTRLKIGQVLRLPGSAPVAAAATTGAAAASTAAPATPAGAKTYVVRSGDTLSSIAQKTLGDRTKWRAIYNLNRQAIGPNENNIEEGMVLKIPAP